MQAAFATQGTQVEPTQTPPVHVEPAAAFETFAQLAPPAPHEMAPCVHSVGRQTAPFTHAEQAPVVSQTPPSQTVPAGRAFWSTQTALPEAQVMTPSRQGWPSSAHETPARHGRQPPSVVQTTSAPHEVPAGWAFIVSVQAGPLLPPHVIVPR